MPPKAKITLGGSSRRPKSGGGARTGGISLNVGSSIQRRAAQPKAVAEKPGKRTGSLMVHPADFSSEQLLINSVAFSDFRVGDLVRVYHPPSSDQPEDGREALLQVVEGTLVKDAEGTVVKESAIRWFSILDSVADFFELRPRAEVAIEAVAKDSTSKYEARFITVSFKDQYLGSADMWRLVRTGQMSDNNCTAMKKVLKLGHGVEAHVEKLYDKHKMEMVDRNNKPKAGLITKGTKTAFRSMSATIHVLVQMSAEMWEFSPSGNLYFEKAVDGFLAALWEKYDTFRATHAVTLVLFARLIYDSGSCSSSGGARTPDGMPCRDFYRVIADSECPEKFSVAFTIRLKQAFATFRDDLERYSSEAEADTAAAAAAAGGGADGGGAAAAAADRRSEEDGPAARLAYAWEGNFLEAVNLSLNTLAQRFRGRNLTRTGESLIVVTAGSGVFEVSQDLNKKTKHRCIDDGIALNLVCLGPAPSHVVPLFIVREPPTSSLRGHRNSFGERRSGFGSDESLNNLGGGSASSGSGGMAGFYRLRPSASEELAPLLEKTSQREPSFRSSPRPSATKGENSQSHGAEHIVRWIVLSWFNPERNEEMVPRKLPSSRGGEEGSEASDDVVGANASIKLLSEEDDYKSPVSQILAFLTASPHTTTGPPSPIPASTEDNTSASTAAARLRSMMEGSPSAEELEKQRKSEEKAKAEEEEFLAACKAYDEMVTGKSQNLGNENRSRSLSDVSRNDRPRSFQASPLLAPTPKEWDAAGTSFLGGQLTLARNVNPMSRNTAGGRPPTAPTPFGRHQLRTSQSMMSLSGMSSRSPALHGLSGPMPLSSIAMPGSAGSAPKRGKYVSPMMLPSNNPPASPPEDFSLDYPTGNQQQQQKQQRSNMVPSSSAERLALAAVDISSDSDNSPSSHGGTPPQYNSTDGSRNSSSSSLQDFITYEGNSSSSLSSQTGMSRSASGSFYGGGHHGGKRRVHRGANPFRPSVLRLQHDAEKRGDHVPAWRRRWANVYTPDAEHSYETADVAKWQSDQGVNWQSLSTPAILPLSAKEKMASIEADLVFKNDRGEQKYLDMPHTATYPPGTYASVHELLIELVCQRLLHDFQIITPATKSESATSTTSWGGNDGSTPRPAWFNPTSSVSKTEALPEQNEFLMSKGPYYHRLVASQDGSCSVSITRYVPSKLKYDKPTEYNYEVWHGQERHYSQRTQSFAAQDYSSMAGLKWDRLDECIAACSVADLRLEEISVTKASTKRLSLVPRNPWEENANTDATGDAQEAMPQVASLSDLERMASIASQGSNSSTSSSTAGGGALSFKVWQDKTRSSFKAFIRAVDELGKMDAESVAAAHADIDEDDVPASHRVDIDVKRSTTRGDSQNDVHEWGWATYDKHFDPLRAWRLDVCWVSWVGVKVAEFLQRLASRARAHGFLLLEMPVDGNAVTGDAGNTLSPAPSSLVCATAFGRRLVEHKLMHQPRAEQLNGTALGFRYDRRLPLTMRMPSRSKAPATGSGGGGSSGSSSGSMMDQSSSPSQLSPWSGPHSSLPHLPALRVRRHLLAMDPRDEDEDAEQLLIAAHQRLSLALLGYARNVSVSLDSKWATAASDNSATLRNAPYNTLAVAVHTCWSRCRTPWDLAHWRRWDPIRHIADAIPKACDTETTRRAIRDINQPGGPSWARERRLLHESMPMQFLHESGGALVGSGRCGSNEKLNRTVRWVDLTTGGSTGRGARARGGSTAAATSGVAEARDALVEAVQAVNICAAIVDEAIESTFEIIVTSETKL